MYSRVKQKHRKLNKYEYYVLLKIDMLNNFTCLFLRRNSLMICIKHIVKL